MLDAPLSFSDLSLLWKDQFLIPSDLCRCFCRCPPVLPRPQAVLSRALSAHIPAWVPNLLQGSLDVDALSPGHGGVGEAVAGVAAAGDVDALPPEVLERLGHHPHPVVREGRRVLEREMEPG